MKKPILLTTVLAVVLTILVVLRGQTLDLENLGTILDQLRSWQEAHQWALVALFFAAYVAVAALSLPLAAWMTLAAGALFGFWQGLLIVSFAQGLLTFIGYE